MPATPLEAWWFNGVKIWRLNSKASTSPATPAKRKRLAWTLSLLLLTGLGWAQDALAFAGSIQQVLGSARIARRSGQQAPAIRGDQLYEGDTVMTSAQSNVQIRMVDDAQVWLRPNTEFKITLYRSKQHGADRDEAKMQLVVGSLRTVTGAISPSKGGDYKLSTPNATIGIRGTEFDAVHATPQYSVEVGMEPGTYNRVYRGSTLLAGSSGSVTLKEGEAGFLGTKPGDRPKTLSSIPAFLDLPPDSTSTGGTGTAASNKGALRVLLWVGELNGSGPATSAISAERKLQLQDGTAATWDLTRAMNSRTADKAGAKVQNPGQIPVRARLSGKTVKVEFFSSSTSLSSISQGNVSASSLLELPMSQWTEVTGRGPWSSQDSAVVAAGGRSGASSESARVYLKVESDAR